MNGFEKYFKLFLFSWMLFCLSSCTDELNIKDRKIDWDLNPELGLPVINANISFAEGFLAKQDSSIYIYPDKQGKLHLFFTDTLATLTVDSVVTDALKTFMPDTNILELPSVRKGFSIESPATYFKIYLDSILDVNQLDSVLLNDGIIQFDFDTWTYYNCIFSVTLPNLTNGKGESIKFLDFVPSETNKKVKLELKDTKLKINTSEKTKGIFTIVLAYEITGKSNQVRIPPPRISVILDRFDVRSAYGKIYDLPVKKKIEQKGKLFTAMKFDISNIELDIADPVIRLKFMNQLGVPFRMDSISLSVEKKGVFQKSISGVQESVYFPAPTFSQQSNFVPATLSIDPGSNIDELFSKFPENWFFSGKVIVNPYEPNRYSFIREQDSLVIKLEGDIPLRFSLNHVTLKATTNIKLSTLEKLESKVEIIKFKTKIQNSFPLELRYQAYFTGEDEKVVDSLFTEPALIKAASGPSTPSENIFYVDKNVDQIRKIKSCTKIISKANFFTAGNSTALVDFNSSQGILLDIILFTRLNL